MTTRSPVSKLGMIYLVAVLLNRDEHGEKVTKTNLTSDGVL